MLRMAILAGVLVLTVSSAAAKSTGPRFFNDPSLNDFERYQHCLALAKTDASSAYEQAMDWHDAGGGPGALHCSAVALVQLGQYPEAAYKLDQLARAHDAGAADMRAELLDQAGNAWLLAGQPENALASFSAAINLGQNDADTLADRARAYAMMKSWPSAEADLTKALAKDQYRADLLVLRASARQAEGRQADARKDVDQALDIDPHYADALVERGTMKLEAGDKKGARADWQIVLATQPKSPAADSARTHIEQLELNEAAPAQAKPAPPKKPAPTQH